MDLPGRKVDCIRMNRNQRIESCRDEMAKALSELIQIPSVSQGQGVAGAPFGEGCRQALDAVFSMAKRMGFERMYDDDGYAGHIEMGEGAECIGVLTHIAVSYTHLDVYKRQPFPL